MAGDAIGNRRYRGWRYRRRRVVRIPSDCIIETKREKVLNEKRSLGLSVGREEPYL